MDLLIVPQRASWGPRLFSLGHLRFPLLSLEMTFQLIVSCSTRLYASISITFSATGAARGRKSIS
jgi:hypothetical protein